MIDKENDLKAYLKQKDDKIQELLNIIKEKEGKVPELNLLFLKVALHL